MSHEQVETTVISDEQRKHNTDHNDHVLALSALRGERHDRAALSALKREQKRLEFECHIRQGRHG